MSSESAAQMQQFGAERERAESARRRDGERTAGGQWREGGGSEGGREAMSHDQSAGGERAAEGPAVNAPWSAGGSTMVRWWYGYVPWASRSSTMRFAVQTVESRSKRRHFWRFWSVTETRTSMAEAELASGCCTSIAPGRGPRMGKARGAAWTTPGREEKERRMAERNGYVIDSWDLSC